MRKKRVLNCLLVLVTTLVAWTGQSAHAQDEARNARVQPDERVLFRAERAADPKGTRVTDVAGRAVLRAFLNEYPQYIVDPFTMPEVQTGSADDTGPLMAIAAGIPPHAIFVNFRQSSTYIEQGFLAPVEILLARKLSDNPLVRQHKDGKWLADPTEEEIAHALELIRQRVPERAWKVVYREDESGESNEKHAWAVPTASLVQAMFYRKDLFNEAGLDPERPPQTWDELLEYSRKLTVPERQQYGISFQSGPALSWSTYTFFVSNGGRAVRRAEDGQWVAAYGTREAAEAVYYVWKLAREPFTKDDGAVVKGSATIDTSTIISQRWKQGKLAIRFDYLDEELLANVNPQLVGISPVPKSWRGERGSEINCRMLGIYSQSPPEVQLAVMDYIWFLTSDQAKQIRTQVYVSNGFGRFISPHLLRQFGYEQLLRQVPEGWIQAFDLAMKSGVPEPFGKNTQNIYRYLSSPVHAALEMDFTNMSREEAINTIHRLMNESAEEVNRKLLGNISPQERFKRRAIASVVLVGIAIVFGIAMIHIWRYFSIVTKVSVEKKPWRRFVWGYILIAPALLLTMFWAYIPLMWGLGLAFTDYRLALRSAFVGVDNFAALLFDDKFWMALYRTFYYVALVIGLGFWPPILLAILLDEVPTAFLKYTFRTMYYLPTIVSGVIMVFLWKQMMDPSSQGVLNQLLLSFNALGPVAATIVKWLALGVWLSFIYLLIMLPIKLDEMAISLRLAMWAMGTAFILLTLSPLWRADAMGGVLAQLVGRFSVEPLRWVNSPELAMLCVVIPSIWAHAGAASLIYLAALKTVPNELYEAADIDGAGHWHKIFYITLPRLKYIIGIQFIAGVIAAFKGGTNNILAMTGGGPNDATMIMALEIFFRTFVELAFGIGSAMAWLFGALLIGLTAYQMKMLSRGELEKVRAKRQ
jgi:multiple sugar transport system permease protein